MTAKTPSNEFTITRVYDASVQQVWDAWTDPAQVAQWWGPRGFTLTTHSKDLRPGGTWHYTMHGPDGIDYPNRTHYLEVDRYRRLVYDHGADDDRPPLFRVTVTFAEVDGKTRMDMTMACESPEAAQQTLAFVKKAGGNTTWDRLAEYLAKESAREEIFVINRSFDAPVDLVFQMWTDPEHLAKWLPPAGADMRFIRRDIRPGGSSFWLMTGPFGPMYGRAEYREIDEAAHRIVYAQQFCDEHETLARHPMVPVWPATMLTLVTFTEEAPDVTRVTVTWTPQGTVTAEELEAFAKMKGSMSQGWTGSFDKLDAALASVRSQASV